MRYQPSSTDKDALGHLSLRTYDFFYLDKTDRLDMV